MLIVCKALANDRRLQILEWLKDPVSHFPPQTDGDLVKDGVCGIYIAEKLGLSQATLSAHMKLLCDAELVRSKRVRQWTFYRRNKKRLKRLPKDIAKL